jgi:NADH:ubiquinone oxidoreductase subunit 5 (subunit L)/multisubunit Na+/H+ antiporter MnhA subunit
MNYWWILFTISIIVAVPSLIYTVYTVFKLEHFREQSKGESFEEYMKVREEFYKKQNWKMWGLFIPSIVFFIASFFLYFKATSTDFHIESEIFFDNLRAQALKRGQMGRM